MTGDALPGAPLDAAQLDDLEERLRRFDGVAWDAGPVFAVIAALRAAWREREEAAADYEATASMTDVKFAQLDATIDELRMVLREARAALWVAQQSIESGGNPELAAHALTVIDHVLPLLDAALGAPGAARPPEAEA